jgi:DNA-binding SARP family transcriptional activator
LDVAGADGPVRIAGAKERLVLASLILRAGQVVSRDALVDALWGDDPPTTAVKTLQGYVARVRRALEGAGLGDAVATRDPGYVLAISADSIDVTDFERRASAGRRALDDGDALRAAAELGAALGMWRGDALADCRGGGWVGAEALRLDELRLSTVEDRIDADLMLGGHGALVGELESLVARHPLRERLWASLMLALYRAGRQADAVRAYQRARELLVEDLGLEPGAELRRLEAAVLAGDPSLDAPDLTVGREPQPAIPLPHRLTAASSAVFVGRVFERKDLTRLLQTVAAGERRVVLVSGEPGIGKTSLAAAFALEAFENGAVVLYGRSDDDLSIPYQPWVEVLAHLASHAPDTVLAAHVEARGSELARLVPDLADPADLAGGATFERASSTDAESERYLLFGAVVDLLTRTAALAPVVLVLDDLHWADRPTIQLLRHVVATATPLPLLIIGTFRDSDVETEHPLAEALADLHRESGIERLALRGLDDDELLALLDTSDGAVASEGGVALRDALSAETDGNPFFVGEMLRHLAETQAVHQDEQGRWVAGADLRISGLPVSIREVINRRVTRLGAQTRAALSLAAVIGREFDTDVLARVAEPDQDTLIELCDRGVKAALLTEADTAGRYTFAHALIEHALHDDLSAIRRAHAHQAIAEALEEIHGGDPGGRIGELAYHWVHAAQPQNATKAITCATRAGDRALAQLAPDEALRWYREALELLDRVSVDDPHDRAALLVGLGDAQRQVGDPEHRETLLHAGRLADEINAIDLLVRAALRNSRGWNSIAGGTDHERIEMLGLALARLGDADSPDRARLLALTCLESTWILDFDERLSMATQAVDIARRTGDKAALVDAIRLSHAAIAMPQTLDLRRRWTSEACELADSLGDPIARLHANDHKALVAVEAGDLRGMTTACAIYESEFERIAQPQYRWLLSYHWAWRGMLEGDLDAAEQTATEALTLGTAAGFPDDALTIYGAQLMCLRWMQGRIHEMIELIEQAAR